MAGKSKPAAAFEYRGALAEDDDGGGGIQITERKQTMTGLTEDTRLMLHLVESFSLDLMLTGQCHIIDGTQSFLYRHPNFKEYQRNVD